MLTRHTTLRMGAVAVLLLMSLPVMAQGMKDFMKALANTAREEMSSGTKTAGWPGETTTTATTTQAPTPAETPDITLEPTPEPAPAETPQPTPEATPEPTPAETPQPTPEATPEPTSAETPEPTPEPTPKAEVTPEPEMPQDPIVIEAPKATRTPAATQIRITEVQPEETPARTPKAPAEPQPPADEKTFRMARKSDGHLLSRNYPRTDFALELRVNFFAPGSVIDTVGLNAAPTGSFSIVIGADNRLQFQVYDPAAESDSKLSNGWHVIRTRDALPTGQDHSVVVENRHGRYTLKVNGTREATLALDTPLSGKPVYVGDFPDDAHWGKGYNINQSVIGTVDVLRFEAMAAEGREQDVEQTRDTAPVREEDMADQGAGLSKFAGRWLLEGADIDAPPDANILALRVAGNRVLGTAGPDKDRVEFGRFDGKKIRGTVEPKGKDPIPATAQLSADGGTLIIELAPPASEFVTVVAKRIVPGIEPVETKAEPTPAPEPEPETSVDTTEQQDDPAAAKAELAKASRAYKRLVENGEQEGLAQARSRYKAALERVRRLEGRPVPPSAKDDTRKSPDQGEKDDGADAAEKPSGASGPVSTNERAIERVSKLPEIVKFRKNVEARAKEEPGHRVGMRADEEEKRFIVQVFEYVPDGEAGHTATFGWYAVDKATGRAYSAMKELFGIDPSHE